MDKKQLKKLQFNILSEDELASIKGGEGKEAGWTSSDPENGCWGISDILSAYNESLNIARTPGTAGSTNPPSA